MATQYEQDLVGQYGSGMQTFIDEQRGLGKSGLLGGVNVDPQDVERIISGFQSSPYAGTNASSAIAGTTPTYNYNDPLGLQQQVNDQYGVNAALDAYNQANKAYIDLQTGIQTENEGIYGDRNISQTFQQGQLAQKGRTDQLRLQTAQNDLTTAQNKYNAVQAQATNAFNILNQERQTKLNLMFQYPEAGITLTDTMDTAQKKIVDYNAEQEKKAQEEARKAEENAKKQTEAEWKKTLQSEIRKLGGSTKTKKGGTMNTKQLEKEYERLTGIQAKKASDLEDLQLAKAKADIAKSGEKTSATAFYQEATRLKDSGKDWGYIANALGKKYDLTPGSTYSNQLDAIMTGQASSSSKGLNLKDLGDGTFIDLNTGDIYGNQ